MDSPTQINPSELRHWGGSLKGTSGILGEAEVIYECASKKTKYDTVQYVL